MAGPAFGQKMIKLLIIVARVDYLNKNANFYEEKYQK
jgi:hypothetical protein